MLSAVLLVSEATVPAVVVDVDVADPLEVDPPAISSEAMTLGGQSIPYW